MGRAGYRELNYPAILKSDAIIIPIGIEFKLKPTWLVHSGGTY
jgi:hypothetical protein